MSKNSEYKAGIAMTTERGIGKYTSRLHRRLYDRRLSVFSVLCAVLAMLAVSGCTAASDQGTNKEEDPTATLPAQSTTPESYDEVFDVIDSIREKQQRTTDESIELLSTEETAVPQAGMDGAGDTAAATESASAYSETNVQVEGINEGDIVKTDGEYIYSVAGPEIVIAKAAGADTGEIARISLDGKSLQKQASENALIYPHELYIEDGMLAVTYQYQPALLIEEGDGSSDGSGSTGSSGSADSSGSSSSSDAAASTYFPSYFYRSVTEVALFDVSDATDPRYIKTLGQDGYFSSSRLQGGILYLVSNYHMSSGDEVQRDDPGTFVPMFHDGSETAPVAVADICILPEYDSITYTVVSSISVQDGHRIDSQSVLGANNTTYMSYDNLYLAGAHYEEVEENSYEDGSFHVIEYVQRYSTRITRLALDAGAVTYGADAVVPGSLLNQFSLDEYDGHLRTVTTVSDTRFRTLDDGKGEVRDYSTYESEPTTNSLLILDESLQITGSIEGLAEDERVYSVRFDGPIGYFVTFRQVDPLFAVDVSDPANPTVKSALKIPGFSSYLHVYGQGRLFGFGMNADDEGRTSGLKLSMFDTTDPYNVTEKHMLARDESYSEALYDHKAILVDAERDLIGFSADDGYLVFGYSDEQGFYQRALLGRASDGYYYSSQRGLYIGDYFYLCEEKGIGVYALDSFDEVAKVAIEVIEPDYGDVVPLMPEASSGSAAPTEEAE